MSRFLNWARVDTSGIINKKAWDRSRSLRFDVDDPLNPEKQKYADRLRNLSATEFESKVKKHMYNLFKHNEYYTLGTGTRATLVETIVDDVLSMLKYDVWGRKSRDETTGRVFTPDWINLSDFVRRIVVRDLDKQKAAAEDDRTQRAERVERAEQVAREMEAAIGISFRPVSTRSAEDLRASELAERAKTVAFTPFSTKKG